jgi:hypothetical protein
MLCKRRATMLRNRGISYKDISVLRTIRFWNEPEPVITVPCRTKFAMKKLITRC